MKLFVSIPISSIWCWWRERKLKRIAAKNEARRERTRRILSDPYGPDGNVIPFKDLNLPCPHGRASFRFCPHCIGF